MHLAQQCQYAVDVFVGRLQDNQFHYGLVFVLPDNRDNSDCDLARKCSDLNTQSRHGTIDDWHVGIPLASLPARHVVLLIPRTWLIKQGYLPWSVLVMPFRPFAIRRGNELQRHFWLEWPEGNGREETQAVVQEAILKVA